MGEIKAQERQGDFKVMICTTTLYSYIDKGIFLRLTNKNLPVKREVKRPYKKVKKREKAPAGESIKKRPKEVESREEFGHWEMDTVKGKRGVSKNSLLVFTERKTRNEIVIKFPTHTTMSVVEAMDRVERKWGELFPKVFKTITVDNGTQFSCCTGLERSIFREGKRTKVYYCYPSSSWERGTNEVTNKMVRRKIPKGTNFDMKTEEIEKMEHWINKYPRRIHNYQSADTRFKKELSEIG